MRLSARDPRARIALDSKRTPGGTRTSVTAALTACGTFVSITASTAFGAAPAASAESSPSGEVRTWRAPAPAVKVRTMVIAAAPIRFRTWTTSAQARIPAIRADSRNKKIALDHVVQRSWNLREFRCLDQLWTRESNWNHHALNRSSGAYGIPQALPAGKMSGAGRDWRSNPETQIRWGLTYIKGRYGRPCGAWGHWRSHNWY
jgi:hypothetical protein